MKAGAHVSKGELLARLDNRSAKVAVAKAHADVVDAEDALTTRAGRGGDDDDRDRHDRERDDRDHRGGDR